MIVVAVISSVVTATVVTRPNGTTGRSVSERITLEENSAVIDAVKKASTSVVSIATTAKGVGFFGDVIEQRGGGTGIIVTADGLILTNKHVIDGASEFTVVTSDGRDYAGTIVSIDPIFDIALVKIDARDLPVAEIGDSNLLEIGQKVIAIGNALGEYQNSVTVGVVSARGRAIVAGSVNGSEQLEGLIQTDAPISSGNSGGPLVNIRGQVVGINTAVDQQGNSIGFAIPVNLGKTALESYLKNGKISRPFMGIRYINITRELAALNHLEVKSGALIPPASGNVRSIVPGGPADKGGIREGDIITSINGELVESHKGITTIISQYAPGTVVEVTYLREGKEAKTRVTLGELKLEQ